MKCEKSKINLSFILILIFFPIYSLGQEISYPQTPIESRLAPPSIHQFLQYTNMQPAEYSGQININVPLAEIGTNVFKVPISLNYVSNGIRVSEEANWVGLGWDLQFGGVVQITNDKDDLARVHPKFSPDYFWHPFPYPQAWTTDELNYSHHYPPNISLSDFPIWEFFGYFWPFQRSMEPVNLLLDEDMGDTEPDIFKANFFGHYLEFIVSRIHGSVNPGIVEVLNEKNYKVFLTYEESEPFWKIISPDGTTFYFDEIIEIDKPRGSWVNFWNCGSGFNPDNLEEQTDFGNGSFQLTIEPSLKSRIWQPTKIVDKNGNVILFNYDQDEYTLYDFSFLDTWTVGTAHTFSRQSWHNLDGPITFSFSGGCSRPHGSGEAYAPPTPFSHSNKSTFYTKAKGRYLKSIEVEGTGIKASFYKSSRIDYFNSKKIDRIDLSFGDNLVTRIVFEYDYFTSQYNGHGKKVPWKKFDELTKRLRLNSLIINDDQIYSFFYDETPLPPKNSYAMDFWGYYNGQLQNNTITSNLLQLMDNPPPELLEVLGANTSTNAAHPTFCQAGILKEIIYPTKGKSNFEYELNTFNNYFDLNQIPNFPGIYAEECNGVFCTHGFGLRLKNHSKWDSDGNLLLRNEYHYEGGKSLIPFLFFNQYGDKIITVLDNTGTGGFITNYNNYATSNSNRITPNLLGPTNKVGYDKVSILQFENSDINGKTTKEFLNEPAFFRLSSVDPFFLAPASIKNYGNGKVLSETILNNNLDTLRTVNYVYDFVENTERHYGVRHNLLGLWAKREDIFGNLVLTDSRRKDHLAFYPIYSGTVRLKEIIETDFFENEFLQKQKLFTYYQANNLLLSINEGLNGGQKILTTFRYPPNSSVISWVTTSERQIYSQLSNKNRVGEVIEITKQNWPSGSFIEKNVLVYKNENDILVPSAVRIGHQPSEWHERFSFNKYTPEGNLAEYYEYGNLNNPTPISTIWGYRGILPIAKIENAAYDLVVAELTAIGHTVENLQNKSESELRAIFSTLRERPNLKDAFITSYTHKPLVGVTSITDPRGQTIFYEYDSFGRLKSIRDQNWKILEEYDYHYAQPQ